MPTTETIKEQEAWRKKATWLYLKSLRWPLVNCQHDWVKQRPGPEEGRFIKDICDSTKNEENSKE